MNASPANLRVFFFPVRSRIALSVLHLAVLAAIFAGGPVVAAETPAVPASRRVEGAQKDPRSEFADRHTEVDQWRKSLDAAKTPAEKQAVMAAYRAKREATRLSDRDLASSARSASESLAAMKAKASGNPEMTARVAKMEERLQGMEKMKESLEKIRAAEGEERRILMAEFQEERKKNFEKRETELSAQRLSHAAGENQKIDVTKLPPEMRAMREKAEARKREIEDLQAALKQADAEERAVLLAAFQAKQDAARTEESEALPSKRPSQTHP